MGGSSVSIPMRVLCAGAAVLAGIVAVSIGVSGEFRTKGRVVELDLWSRCLMAGVLGLMAIVAGWVAVRGRA